MPSVECCGDSQDQSHRHPKENRHCSDPERIAHRSRQHRRDRCAVVEGRPLSETAGSNDFFHIVPELDQDRIIQTHLFALFRDRFITHTFRWKWVSRHDTYEEEQQERNDKERRHSHKDSLDNISGHCFLPASKNAARHHGLLGHNGGLPACYQSNCVLVSVTISITPLFYKVSSGQHPYKLCSERPGGSQRLPDCR